MKSWPLPLLLVVLAGCGAGGTVAAPAAADKPAVTVDAAKAVRRPIRKLLTIQGSLVASQGGSAKLSPMVAGRLTNVFVKEGQVVRQGQLLATVNVSVQAAQKQSAQAGAQAAQAQALMSELSYRAAVADHANAVETARLALESARLDRDSTVTQAQIAFDSARTDLARTRNGARPQERIQAQQAVVQAQVARNRAKTDFGRAQALAAEGFMSQRDLDTAKATYESAESALASAQASYDLVKLGARPEDLKAAELKAAGTRDALNAAKALGDRKVAQAETAFRQAEQARLAVAAKQQDAAASKNLAAGKLADLAASSATAALGEIRAPFDGTITRRNLGSGDFADLTSVVFEIVGSGIRLDFLGGVPASLAGDVRPGMAAIVGDSPGRVANVSPADPLTGISTIRVVGAFQGTIGSYTTSDVVLETHPNTIAVPKETLVDHEGKQVVFRIDGDTAKMVEVKTGPEDSGFVEVLSGIKPGDTLVKLGQYELSDGDKVKVAAPASKEPAP